MNTPKIASTPLSTRTIALFIFGAALLLPIASVSAAPAAETVTLHSLADKAPKLPLDSSFAKETSGENKGLYTLTLKNTSQNSVKVGGTIEQSVVSHNRPKTLPVEPQAIGPGKTRKIEGLAAHDKITLTADGFEALELTVP